MSKRKDLFEQSAREETNCQDASVIDKPSFYSGYLAGAHFAHDSLADSLILAKKQRDEFEVKLNQAMQELAETRSIISGKTFDFDPSIEKELAASRAECERLKERVDTLHTDKEYLALHSELTDERSRAKFLVEALEYQKVAWRKICEGSMFTPESERTAAEKVIDRALTKYQERGA